PANLHTSTSKHNHRPDTSTPSGKPKPPNPEASKPEAPNPETLSTSSAAPGPRASTGTRQLASDTRPRRAGTEATGTPGIPGASGRTSSGEASGPPPDDGSCRVSSSWTALRTASPADVLTDPGGDPASRSASSVAWQAN